MATPLQKQILNGLIDGMYIMRTQGKPEKYTLYKGNMSPVRRFGYRTFASIRRAAAVDILKSIEDRRMVLDTDAVEQLPATSYLFKKLHPKT